MSCTREAATTVWFTASVTALQPIESDAAHDTHTKFQAISCVFLLVWRVARGSRSPEHDLRFGTNYPVSLRRSARIPRPSAAFLFTFSTFFFFKGQATQDTAALTGVNEQEQQIQEKS